MEEKQISYPPSSSAEEARAQSHNNSPGRLTYIDTNDAASNTDALFRAVGRPDSVAFRKLLETTSAEDIVIKRNNRLLTEYLWMAASWPLAEKRELLQMLKERGAIWSSPVFEALCLSNNLSNIQSAYTNHPAEQRPIRDSEGHTLLHYAVIAVDLLPVIQWIISANIVRAEDANHIGITPLLLAAGKGHLATVQYLLSPEGGASIKEQDNNRNTALLWAAVNNHSGIVRWLLLEGGASMNDRNRYGLLAYNLAYSPEIKSFLEAFKKCGKDPLNYVITYRDVDALQRIVVQRKAQKSLSIEERNNLLKISVEQEFSEITRLILEEFTSSEELPLLRDLTSLSENTPLSRALTPCQQMSLRRIQELGKQQYDDAARVARNRSDSGATTSYPLEEKAMNDNLLMLTEAAVPEEVRQQLADFLRANFSLQNTQSEVMRQLYSAIKAPMELVDLDTITVEHNLNTAKPPQGAQQPKEAEAKEEAIASHLQKEMIAVRELIGQCVKTHLSAYPELCEALQRLDAYYHAYQTSLAEACSAGALHDQIFKQYSLLGLGKPRYLTPAAKSVLALPLEKLKRDNNDFGMHTVIRAGDLYFKLSPEGNDCAPGMEFAVTAFYDVVAGVGTAPTRLLRVKGPECSHIYVASKAVLGPNLRHTLQYGWEAFYEQLDPFNFSVQVIVSLLTRPADAKADNFLVVPRTNSQRIIGVDNDLAFASPIVPGPADDPEHYPELICLFFFFPQMQHPIDREVREHLLNTHPALLMVDWLSKLDQQNKRYQSLQEAGTFNERELNRLQLPIRFCAKTIANMYNHLHQIRQLLSQSGEITHQQLFETLYPELAKYYGTILEEAKRDAHKSVAAAEAHSEPTTPSSKALTGQSWPGTVVLDATDRLYERLISLEKAAALRQSPDRRDRDNQLSRFARERYANHYAFELRDQALPNAMEELLQQIDYSKLKPEKAALLLKKIEDLSSLEVLCLRGYHIKDRSLMSLLSKLPHLKQLHLQQCEGVTVHLIREIIRCYPQLHIAFDKCKDYRASALQSAFAGQADVNVSLLSAVTKQPAYYLIKAGVMQYAKKDDLRSHQRLLDTQEFHNYLADESLTEDSASFTPQLKNNLKTLLTRCADINGSNKAETPWQGDLPLHTAFVKGNIALTDWLIKQGANPSRKDPRCNETPFERLQRVQQQDQNNEKYRVFIDWLSQHHPNIVEPVKPEEKEKFLRENKDDPDSYELVSADQQAGQSFPNTPAPSPQLSQEFTFSSSSSSSADLPLLLDACHAAIDRNDLALLEILLQLPCDEQEEYCRKLAADKPANAQELFQSFEKYKQHHPNIQRKEQQEKYTKVQLLLNGPRSQEILHLLKCKSVPQAEALVMRSKLSIYSVSEQNEKSLIQYAQEKKELKDSNEATLPNLQHQERQQAAPILEPLLNNQPSVLLNLAKAYAVSKREEDKVAFQERYAAKETTLAEKQQFFKTFPQENVAYNVLLTLLDKPEAIWLRTTPEIAESDKPLMAYILGGDIKNLFRFPLLPLSRDYLADREMLYHLLKESRIPPTLKLKAYDDYLKYYSTYLDIHQAKQWLVDNNFVQEMRYYLQKSILSEGTDPQLLDDTHTKRLTLLSAIEGHTVEETISRLRDIWGLQEKAMHLSPTAKPAVHRALLKAFLSSSGIEPFLNIAEQIEKQLQEIETPSHGGFSRLETPSLYWYFNDELLENTGHTDQVFFSAIAGDEHDSGFEALGITRKKLILFLLERLNTERHLSSLSKMLLNQEIPTPLHQLLAKEYQTLLLAGKLNDIATEAQLSLKRQYDESQDAAQKQQVSKSLKSHCNDTNALLHFVKFYLGQQGPFPYHVMKWYVKERRHHYQLWERKEDGQIQYVAGAPLKTTAKLTQTSATEAGPAVEEMKTDQWSSNADCLSGVRRILAIEKGVCYQRLALANNLNVTSINAESVRELEVLCLYSYFLHYLYLNLSEGCQEEKHRPPRNKLINFLRYIAKNDQTAQKTLEDVKSLLNTPIIFADDKPSVIGMQHPDIVEIFAEVDRQQFRPTSPIAEEKTNSPEPSPSTATAIRRPQSERSLSAYRENSINPDHLYEEARIKLTALLSTLNKKQLQPYLNAWEAERKYQEQTNALSMIEPRSSRQQTQLEETTRCLLKEREIMATFKAGLLGTLLPASIPTLTDLDALLAIKYRLDKRKESPTDTPLSNTLPTQNNPKLERYKQEIRSLLNDLERVGKLTSLDLDLRVSLRMVHSKVIEIEKTMPRNGEKYQTPHTPVSLSQELADNFYALFCDMAMAMIAHAEEQGQHHLNTIIHASPAEAGLIIKPLRLSDGVLELLSPILGLPMVPVRDKPESPDQRKKHQRLVIERLGIAVVKHYHQQIALISLAKESQGPKEFAEFLLTLTCLFMFSKESADAKTPDDILHWLDTPRNLMLPKSILYTGEKISLVGKGKATCSDLVHRSGYRCKVQGTPEQADDNDEGTILYAIKTPGHPEPLPEFGFRNATQDQAQEFQKAIYDARSMHTWYDYPSGPQKPRLTPETVQAYQDPKQQYTQVEFNFEPTRRHDLMTLDSLRQENAGLKARNEELEEEIKNLKSENARANTKIEGLIADAKRDMAEKNFEHAQKMEENAKQAEKQRAEYAQKMEERIRQVTAQSTESARQEREASEQRLRERDVEHAQKIQQITAESTQQIQKITVESAENARLEREASERRVCERDTEHARQMKESAEQAEKERRAHAQQMQEVMKLVEMMTKKQSGQSREEENDDTPSGRPSEAAAVENTTPLPCRR